jgi:predicted DCC family thiol-disulfide oxidoreductase YuxK
MSSRIGLEQNELPAMSLPKQTTPPGSNVLLYDGFCKFCTAQSKNLLALARKGAVEAISFQDTGVLDRFPGVTHDACMEAMHLITQQGRIYRGFEAAVRAVATRRVIGLVAYGYYFPGIRQICDWAYRRVAARRYEIMGKAIAAGECDGGTCSIHARKQAAAH